MKHASKAFIAAGLLLLVIWLVLRDVKCNKRSSGPDLIEAEIIKRTADSVEKQWAIIRDNLATLATEKEHVIDSLKQQKQLSDKSLNSSQREVNKLVIEVRKAKESRDTPVIVEKCVELADQVENLTQEVEVYRKLSDDLTVQQDSLVKVMKDKSKKAEEFASSMRKSLSELTTVHESVVDQYTKDLAKANKKLNRKFNVSLSAGGGIAPQGGIQPFVGVTLGRTIIRL